MVGLAAASYVTLGSKIVRADCQSGECVYANKCYSDGLAGPDRCALEAGGRIMKPANSPKLLVRGGQPPAISFLEHFNDPPID
jgi:hypothetical protein